MNVRPHGDTGVFWVQSESNKGEYFVDILAYNGHGWCECEHFKKRINPKLRIKYPEELDAIFWDQNEVISDALQCKHIRAAKKHLLKDIIRNLVHTQKEKKARFVGKS